MVEGRGTHTPGFFSCVFLLLALVSFSLVYLFVGFFLLFVYYFMFTCREFSEKRIFSD